MLLLQEKCFFADQVLELELHDDLRYRLAFSNAVVYVNDERRIGNRRYPYTFKSVEQLRYDFERDVAAAGGRLGENP
jgi:uncharacterized protein (DUF1499 family)